MASAVSLQGQGRVEQGKGAARKLRAAGRVPAVVYGHGETTHSITVDAHELDRLFAGISVENTLIDLAIDDGPPIRALVREVQVHPHRAQVLHVDFYQIHAGERVSVMIPIRVVGTAEGVKLGGVLDQMLHDLPVRCLADQIPEAIDVDVSALAIGDAIHVGALAIPAGVQVEIDPERTVCSVTPPTVPALTEGSEESEGPGGGMSPDLVRRKGSNAE
jgi:large subunit ribosomal protein L25